jgi:hypothetical protein
VFVRVVVQLIQNESELKVTILVEDKVSTDDLVLGVCAQLVT